MNSNKRKHREHLDSIERAARYRATWPEETMNSNNYPQYEHCRLCDEEGQIWINYEANDALAFDYETYNNELEDNEQWLHTSCSCDAGQLMQAQEDADEAAYIQPNELLVKRAIYAVESLLIPMSIMSEADWSPPWTLNLHYSIEKIYQALLKEYEDHYSEQE